jgi:hypothetical protein
MIMIDESMFSRTVTDLAVAAPGLPEGTLEGGAGGIVSRRIRSANFRNWVLRTGNTVLRKSEG